MHQAIYLKYNLHFYFKEHSYIGNLVWLNILVFKTRQYWSKTPYYLTNVSKCLTTRWFNTFSIYRPIEAIEVIKLAGFGNNLISVLNALNIADHLKVDNIYFNQNDFWWINPKLPVGKFRFIQGEPSYTVNCLRDDFFNEYPCCNMSFEPYQDLFISHFESILPKIEIPKDDLIIHIRSGDIYKGNINVNYAQPPLCFYTSIIKKKKWRKIIILSVDKVNPVIPALIKMGAELHRFDLKTTLQYIYYSKNFVYGQGTFVESILMCCNYSKTIYKFGGIGEHVFKNHSGRFNKTFRIYVNPRSSIYHEKMFPWKKSDEQLHIQMNSECDKNWHLISHGSG